MNLEDLNEKTKLMAQEEFEKIKKALTIEKMLDNQGQIQSNLKMKIQLDSSQILLPIFDPGQETQNFDVAKIRDAWIFNTGNLQIKNQVEQEFSEADDKWQPP